MKKIDLTNWVLLSERQSTRNYTSPDGKWMVKVFLTKDESNLGELQKEQDLSSYVYSLGISTPKAGGLVKVIGGSVGAVYQNIPGKKSLIRAISEDWDNMPSYIHRFVELGTVIRSKPCDKERFVPVEERMKKNCLSQRCTHTKRRPAFRIFWMQFPSVTTVCTAIIIPEITSSQGMMCMP